MSNKERPAPFSKRPLPMDVRQLVQEIIEEFGTVSPMAASQLVNEEQRYIHAESYGAQKVARALEKRLEALGG